MRAYVTAEPTGRRSNRSVLLLQRRSKHNDNKWGLPGGNVEDADASLLDTAKREAAEEMGDVPNFAVTGIVETRSAALWPWNPLAMTGLPGMHAPNGESQVLYGCMPNAGLHVVLCQCCTQIVVEQLWRMPSRPAFPEALSCLKTSALPLAE